MGSIPLESLLDPTVVPVQATDCNDAACLAVSSITLHPFKPESEGLDGVLLDLTIENRSVEGGLAYSVPEFTVVDAEGFAYRP